MRKTSREPTHKDAVCGMDVSRKTAAAVAEYQGKRYYFCADMCREKFEAEPEKYVQHPE